MDFATLMRNFDQQLDDFREEIASRYVTDSDPNSASHYTFRVNAYSNQYRVLGPGSVYRVQLLPLYVLQFLYKFTR
jgi:hypothetical protein